MKIGIAKLRCQTTARQTTSAAEMFVNASKPQQHNSSNAFFWLIAALELLQRLNHYACAESVNYGNASANVFRFGNDFEPRYAANTRSNHVDPKESRSVAPEVELVGYRQNVVANETRKPRGFQFHADRNDISIDIEFIIPFAKIPIERSMEVTASAFRNLVNLNTGSLFVSGAFVAVGAAVAGIVKTLSTPTFVVAPGYGLKKKKLRADGKLSNRMGPFNLLAHAQATNDSAVRQKSVIRVDDLVSSLESKLHENDINMSACIQKSICAYVKQASTDVRMGKASGLDKIIDGFASLDQMESYLGGTAVQNAIDAGKSTNSCDYVYRSCKWSQPANKVMKFLTSYLKYINT